MNRDKLVTFLRQLASTVEGMAEADLQDFFSDLSAGMAMRRAKPSRPSVDRKSEAHDIDRILQHLREELSREAAFHRLKGLHLTKRELSFLAKKSGVYVVKEDNIARLEEKIVESVVGARLNSNAIRGGEYIR